jgi:Protein of unknown function (DUF3515)
VHVTPPNPSGPQTAACARLVDYLPAVLDGKHSRVVEPRSPLVHAWGSPPIVLRCGVPQPADYDPGSPQTASVDGVIWFQHIGRTTVTWTAIRHAADVELIVPTSYAAQGGFLVELGKALKQTID